jgi:lipopolysaccharide biosynthesis protein
MEQTYSPENDIAFIDSVIPFFRDPRHLRVNGAPALVVYRPQHMPDARATAERWRAHCREAGIGEIHLIAALTHGNDDFVQFGFDAGVEFPPHNVHTSPRRPPQNLVDKVDAQEPLTGIIWDYGEVARSFIVQDHTGRRVYRGVFPAWDNTARVGTRAVIIQGGTPGNYERWLDATSHRTVAERAPGERLVFINAWNEWAEGCHLEPCREFGRDFLEATRRVKTGHSTADVEWEAALPVAGQSARAALRAAAPPRPAAYAPDTPLTTRLAIKVSNALQRYPTLHDAARSAYRATVRRDGTR